MSSTVETAPHSSPIPERAVFGRRWIHGAATVRILFGALWAIDAIFKWLPGFVHGQTLGDELGKAPKVSVPVIHQWVELWSTVGTANPSLFAHLIAILETAVAIALLLGVFSNAAFIGSAALSFGIWSGAEAFHIPWNHPGMTDLGASAGYVFASLGLFFAAAGSAWSLDSRLRLGSRLGALSWLAAPALPSTSSRD